MSLNFDPNFNYKTKFYFVSIISYIFLINFKYAFEPNVVQINFKYASESNVVQIVNNRH